MDSTFCRRSRAQIEYTCTGTLDKHEGAEIAIASYIERLGAVARPRLEPIQSLMLLLHRDRDWSKGDSSMRKCLDRKGISWGGRQRDLFRDHDVNCMLNAGA